MAIILRENKWLFPFHFYEKPKILHIKKKNKYE